MREIVERITGEKHWTETLRKTREKALEKPERK